MNKAGHPLRPAPLGSVDINGGFWAPWQRVNREVTIPYVLDMCEETGRTDSLALAWTPDKEWAPHAFYDSDIAKAVEAAAYSVHTDPDETLASRLEQYVSLFENAQQPDGYLNSYYTQTGPQQRWTNLRDKHELYCAGHIIEAAVAHHGATGSRRFLEIAMRYADHIHATFGPADAPSPNGGTKRPGYPGHEEIELALVKLFRATGEERYLELARFFVNERGSEPHYFRLEAARRGEHESEHRWDADDYPLPYAYYQAHKPVREQESAEGHSVRACYLYAGMADVARETGDEELLDACRRLFANIAERRMYVTGGIGSHRRGERFTFDYDLPNESAYAETCASIALMFFASRLADIDLDSRYADVAERALYNGVLGGLSLRGDRFFYANPLTYHPTAPLLPHVRSDGERRPWYGCACCPPNIARLIASLGSYVYSVSPATAHGGAGHPTAGETPTVAVHLYAHSRLDLSAIGGRGTLVQRTHYPWEGEISFTYEGDAPTPLTLALRIPGWASAYKLSGPGTAAVESTLRRGYLTFTRTWHPGDTVTLSLPFELRRVYAHPEVRQDGWQVALERGPVVYCMEGIDNGHNLAELALPAKAELTASFEEEVLGGCTVVRGEAVRRGLGGGRGPAPGAERPLYGSEVERTTVAFTAIPFALRANRGACEMRVWLKEV
jgi:hypothetical protein